MYYAPQPDITFATLNGRPLSTQRHYESLHSMGDHLLAGASLAPSLPVELPTYVSYGSLAPYDYLGQIKTPKRIEDPFGLTIAPTLPTNGEAADLDADLLAVLAHPQLAPLWAVAAPPPTAVLLAGAPPAPDPLPARVVEEPAIGRVSLLDFPLDAADGAARAEFRAYADRYRALGFPDIRAWWFDLETRVLTEVS